MFDQFPSILTDAEVAGFAATIALLTAIVQNLSFVPIPDGSKARAWVIAVLAALFVGLNAPAAGLAGAELAQALVLSFAALAGAALGLNRAGSTAASAVTARASSGPEGAG